MRETVLVVDDAAFMRMILKDLLNKNGYGVIEAEDGLVGVQKYMESRPDLVLMDITMPEMDGISAVRAIKAKDPMARIVMCTAMGQQSMVISAIQAGALDFIVKPFKPDRVLEAVNKALLQ